MRLGLLLMIVGSEVAGTNPMGGETSTILVVQLGYSLDDFDNHDLNAGRMTVISLCSGYWTIIFRPDIWFLGISIPKLTTFRFGSFGCCNSGWTSKNAGFCGSIGQNMMVVSCFFCATTKCRNNGWYPQGIYKYGSGQGVVRHWWKLAWPVLKFAPSTSGSAPIVSNPQGSSPISPIHISGITI